MLIRRNKGVYNICTYMSEKNKLLNFIIKGICLYNLEILHCQLVFVRLTLYWAASDVCS